MLPYRTALLAAVASAALLTGCQNTNPDTEVVDAGDVAVLTETEEYDGDVGGTGFAGTIAVVQGCVGVEGDDPLLLVFPAGTEVSGEGEDLVISVDGVELRIGDRFEAGARTDEKSLSEFGDLAEQAPEACRDLDAVPVHEFSS